MTEERYEKNHFFIRVGDGINFRNSKYPIWGIKYYNGIKTIIQKYMKSGDILWFITSKTTTNKTSIVIGMAEYVNMYDRRDETIIALNTYTNEEIGWSTDTNWDIQITYKNLYCGNNIEKHNK